MVFAGVGVGAGITPAMITYVMIHYGWRWSFWMSAVLGVLSLVRCGARYAGGTSNGFSTRTGKHSRLGESNHGLRDIRLLRSNRQTRNRELGHHIR